MKFTENVAATALAVVLILIVCGAIWLEFTDHNTPDLLQIIGGAAVGALGNQIAKDYGP